MQAGFAECLIPHGKSSQLPQPLDPSSERLRAADPLRVTAQSPVEIWGSGEVHLNISIETS